MNQYWPSLVSINCNEWNKHLYLIITCTVWYCLSVERCWVAKTLQCFIRYFLASKLMPDKATCTSTGLQWHAHRRTRVSNSFTQVSWLTSSWWLLNLHRRVCMEHFSLGWHDIPIKINSVMNAYGLPVDLRWIAMAMQCTLATCQWSPMHLAWTPMAHQQNHTWTS